MSQSLSYNRALLTYTDIMGFRNLVARSELDGSLTPKLYEMLSTLNDFAKGTPEGQASIFGGGTGLWRS